MKTAHTLTAAVGGALGAMVHHHQPRCLASGWPVSPACACDGVAVCPVCTRTVSAAADPAHPGAVRIGGHAR